MALTWNETIDLLKVVTAKDRRTVGEADIEFWHAASLAGEWPNLEFAVASVVRHTNDSPGVWLEPGHITAYWRKIKSETFDRWSPPAPPQHMIDDPAAIRAHARDDFNRHLGQACSVFAGRSADDRMAQLDRLRR